MKKKIKPVKEKKLSLKDLVPHEKNPRSIKEKRFRQLEASLVELGDLGGIVFNSRLGRLVGGHMRTNAFKSFPSTIHIENKLVKPDDQGTIATGYVEITHKKKTYKYTYREVDWDEKTHEKAMIQANKITGEFDMDDLANYFDVEDLVEYGYDLDELIGKDVLEPDEKPEEKKKEKKMKVCPSCSWEFE